MIRLADVLFRLEKAQDSYTQLKAAKLADDNVRNPAAMLALFYARADDQPHAKTWMVCTPSIRAACSAVAPVWCRVHPPDA